MNDNLSHCQFASQSRDLICSIQYAIWYGPYIRLSIGYNSVPWNWIWYQVTLVSIRLAWWAWSTHKLLIYLICQSQTPQMSEFQNQDDEKNLDLIIIILIQLSAKHCPTKHSPVFIAYHLKIWPEDKIIGGQVLMIRGPLSFNELYFYSISKAIKSLLSSWPGH